MRTICVIPVRGGSKGIPRKNAVELIDGVSLLEWTIRQAQQVYSPEDIVVSTEDDELSSIAAACRATVVLRPADLAQDHSTTASVVEHLLASIDADAIHFLAITILQVTSPLRGVDDIVRSVEMIKTGVYDSVVSAYETMECHPAKLYFMMPEGAVSVSPEYETLRRQDLPKVFRRNGAIFIVTRQYFNRTGRLWGGKVGLVQMSKERSIDIDAPADLEAARRLLSSRQKEGF